MKYEMDFVDQSFFEKLMEVGLPLRGTYFDFGITTIVAAIVGAVATVGSGVASYAQGQSQASAARYQATYAQQMAQRNQQLAQVAANQAGAKGQYEAGLLREKQKQMYGKQMALYGASGVDPTSGSPFEVMGNTAAQYERDALEAIKNANYEAWRYTQGGETSLLEGNAAADRYNQSAGNYETQGMTSLIAAPLVAGTSILTAYGKYQLAQKSGPYTLNPMVAGSGG